MTYRDLFWFKCKRCGVTFRSYVEGKPIWNCKCEEGFCFDDEDIGEIHDNSFLYPVPNKRECRKCRKGLDLLGFSNDIQINNK